MSRRDFKILGSASIQDVCRRTSACRPARGPVAGDLAGQPAGVRRIGMMDDPRAREDRQQRGHRQAEAVEHRQEADERILPRAGRMPSSTLCRLLSMLRCVSGTALGAFSEPDVNNTTACLAHRGGTSAVTVWERSIGAAHARCEMQSAASPSQPLHAHSLAEQSSSRPASRSSSR